MQKTMGMPRPRRPVRPPAAEQEAARFRELAYRLVRCTDPEEEQRLKAQVVTLVLLRPARNKTNRTDG